MSRHNNWIRRAIRGFFGLPQHRCENLHFVGNGGVRACLPCLFASAEFARQSKAVRAIAEQAKERAP